jgi:D-hydroxyproline dehydrogenase subunit beta
MSGNVNRVGIFRSGIVGLAHAWAAARAGNQVTVVERSDNACGASVWNFGMFWPPGQPAELYPAALRNRELWLELVAAAGIHARPTGSVHVLDREHEATVLERLPGVHIATAMAGSGMTMSFGLADRFFAQRLSSV